MRRTRVLLGASVALTAWVLPVQHAAAACHAFTISASPASVDEGAATTITVERDGVVGPSSVRVRSVDGTAKAGADYAAVAERTIDFTDGTTRSFTVPTVNDTAAEGAEMFRVELVPGSGGGCAASSNFTYGPPATVTIKASDQPVPTIRPTSAAPTQLPPTTRPTTAPPATTPPATASSAPATSAPASGSASASESAALSPSETPTPASTFLADPPDDDDDGSVLPLVLALLAAVAVAAALAVWLRRRGGLRFG